MGNGAIYFIRMVGTDCFKIGYTNDLSNRVKSLQTTAPRELILYATLESSDPQELEQEIHQLLAAYQTDGGREWFEIDELVLRQHILKFGGKFVKRQRIFQNYKEIPLSKITLTKVLKLRSDIALITSHREPLALLIPITDENREKLLVDLGKTKNDPQ